MALDTDLSPSERLIFIRLCSAVAGSTLGIVGLTIFIWEYTASSQRWIVLTVFFIFILIALFIMIRYILLHFFATKRSLDFLIRDTLHELNVPLSVIKANLQLLQANETNSKHLQRLGRIQVASDDLYRLYQDVEYYIRSQIRTKIEEPFELYETLCDVIELCRPLAGQAPILNEALHVSLLGDKRGFCKAITNVLSNAIKYNCNNAPILLYQQGNILIIEDQGIGMSESELFLVFDRYYQADTTQEGYGIGLSLVKAFCDASQISLGISSVKGKGTKVSFDLSSLVRKHAII